MKRQDRLKQYLASTTLGSGGDEGLEAAFPADTMERLVARSPFARSEQERDAVLETHRKLRDNLRLSPHDLSLYEAIVVPTQRPPLLVRRGTYERPPEPWTAFDGAAIREKLEPALGAIGRVELEGPSLLPYAGTAFVVGPGLLMTNRHVAETFARGIGTQTRFIDGFGAAIDLVREEGQAQGPTRAVARVAMIHPYWDMALLVIEDLSVPHLKLQPEPPRSLQGRPIAVVGYPFEDGRNPLDVQTRVFEGIFGVKRLQPGYALGERQYSDEQGVFDVLGHDASTLGGNSGSAVLDPATGHVLGLHFAGAYLSANYAVPASELSRDDRVRAAGVQFAAGSAEMPNPWRTEWETAQRAPSGVSIPKGLSVSASHAGVRTDDGPRTRAASSPAPGSSFSVTIPIEITVRVN